MTLLHIELIFLEKQVKIVIIISKSMRKLFSISLLLKFSSLSLFIQCRGYPTKRFPQDFKIS